MDELVQRLTTGTHEVAVGGFEPSAKDLGQRIDEYGYVHVKFTGTRGGTDLGIEVDLGATKRDEANFESGTGSVHLEGTLSLNYEPVRCIADIDLATLTGTGYLVLDPQQQAGEDAKSAESATAG